MATIARVLESGSTLFDLNNGSDAVLLSYQPVSPALLSDDNYDLVTPVKDVMQVSVYGATRDAVAATLSLMEEKCYRIGKNRGNYYEVSWQANGLTQPGKAVLRAANILRNGEMLVDTAGNYRQAITVNLTRLPTWFGTWQTITLDASTPGTIDNDDTNYVVFPTLLGDLPGESQLLFTSSGGNTANAKRFLIAQKIWNTPANFSHILQVESATALNAALTNQSSTNYSPGGAGVTVKAWNPTVGNTDFRSLARWDITTNLPSWRGTYLVLLRLSENATNPTYRFKVRGGDIVGANYIPGAWGTADKIRAGVSTAGATTEFLLLSLGLIRLPRYDAIDMPKDGIFIELQGEALADSAGAVYLDCVYLMPLNDAGNGLGMLAGEFDIAFSAGKVAVDSRNRQVPLYLSDGTDFLAGCTAIPQGGQIYLYPRVPLQRVYFLAMRNEAEFFKHNRTNTFTVTAKYQPRYINLPGLN